ncbi:MAG: GspE/PulE family protein [Candidatus Omnitrophica bacterium]|nr:GspE/PulE family protein [Candidatus Omnitrophota bacterium]MDD5310335.1 GspE/PulE family protein [Candidatus Omnitrophota bacterium]MDD5545880.1 GspE/PulE family protein [Candidatus Omnitrophota bacterium]
MAIKDGILIGEMLIIDKVITPEQLEMCLNEQKKSGKFICQIIADLGFAAEEKVLTVLSRQLGIPYVKLKERNIPKPVAEKVPARFAVHYKLMPLEEKDGILSIVVTDPLDLHTLDDIKLILGCEVRPLLGGEKDIIEAVKKYYGIGADTIESIMAETAASGGPSLAVEEAEELVEDASIIKFVNQIIQQAYHDRATDIHIEPYEDELKVRYRIDGVLYDAAIPPNIKYFQSAIISRIKIMSNLNIAEHRLPQDGRMKVKVGQEDLDLRVSILPTPYGESVGIRLLFAKMLYSLEDLGLADFDLKILNEMIKKPHGIILLTGPTGSGKTTTLYACLSKINNRELKILTIEDPIEYHLKGITQIQVHNKVELTFAKGLRSMLRHDPDVMMVGEIRDVETAEIAIRVALTGHLVFSTLHTNDAAGATTRLLDMGIEPYLVASSVECVIAQRLVRLICPKCKRPAKDAKVVLQELGMKDAPKGAEIYEGKGCEACKFTGYRGRTAIHEFLVLNEEIREMVLNHKSADQIGRKAVALGMRTLRNAGIEKILKGLTTAGEVMRVTPKEDIPNM